LTAFITLQKYQAGFAVPARLALIGKTDLAESWNLDDALLKIFLCHLAIGQSLSRSDIHLSF
jgi:hypothetical protein